METLKISKEDLSAEYIRFCNDMILDSKNDLVKQDFASTYIEHTIGCFGFFENDFFISKDLTKIREEIIKVLKGE